MQATRHAGLRPSQGGVFIIMIVFAFVLLGAGPPARSSIIVLGIAGDRVEAAFVEALRIQLARSARVEFIVQTGDIGRQSTSAHARSLVRETGALVAVWLERRNASSAAGEDWVVYAVDGDPRHAPVEVERSQITAAPGAERALALKVGELMDSVLATEPREELLEVFADHANKKGRPRDQRIHEAEPSASSLRWLLEAGGHAAGNGVSNLVWGPVGALGARYDRGNFGAEAFSGFRLASTRRVDKNGSAVSVSEATATFGLRGLHALGHFSVGVGASFVLALLGADGVAASGRSGSERAVVPAMETLVEGRLNLTRPLELRLAGGLEAFLVHQRFSVEAEPVFDRGWVRGLAQFSLVARLP